LREIELLVSEWKRVTAAQDEALLRAENARMRAEIDALAAVLVGEWKRVVAARGEAEARAERLAEALRELEGREQRDEALLRQALEALELRCGTNAEERNELIPALRERLGVKA
jgi:acyl-CoA reductase-like NAD-dependent aldehyde dehydrogenase